MIRNSLGMLILVIFVITNEASIAVGVYARK